MDAPRPRREVLFERLREDEILNLPKETIEELVLIGEPLVFRVGSAVLLGSFKVEADRLVTRPDRGWRRRGAGVTRLTHEAICHAA
jgi:hypothetical protein